MPALHWSRFEQLQTVLINRLAPTHVVALCQTSFEPFLFSQTQIKIKSVNSSFRVSVSEIIRLAFLYQFPVTFGLFLFLHQFQLHFSLFFFHVHDLSSFVGTNQAVSKFN